MSLLLLLKNVDSGIRTGTGAWALQPAALAGSGWMVPDGTASPSLFRPTMSASGEVVFTATAAFTIPSIISLTAVGAMVPDGVGELRLFVPALAGSGWAVTRGSKSSSRIPWPTRVL